MPTNGHPEHLDLDTHLRKQGLPDSAADLTDTLRIPSGWRRSLGYEWKFGSTPSNSGERGLLLWTRRCGLDAGKRELVNG